MTEKKSFQIKDLNFDQIGQAAKEALMNAIKNKELQSLHFSEVSVRLNFTMADGAVIHVDRLIKLEVAN